MDSILSYLLSNPPWLAVLLIAIIVTWLISKYHTKLELTRKKVDELPCDNELHKMVTSTNDMVVEINKWLMKFDNDMIDKLAQKASPLKMTPLGEVLFKKSSAQKTVDDHIDFLIDELEKINPLTAYDVEEEALGFLFKNMGHEMFTDIKQFIYYSPDTIELTDPASGTDKEIKLSIQSIVKLMSIYLRDIYLSKHPDIK